MAAMTRFALIDNHSGFVWGVTDAASAIDACRQIDADLGEYGREYEEVPRFDASNDTGYYVHQAPAGWDCDDGQDEAAIAEVNAMPKVACVLIERA